MWCQVTASSMVRNCSLTPRNSLGKRFASTSAWVSGRIPLSLPESTLGLGPAPAWIVILFVYAMVASLLPVWLLLQPRDFINGIQLAVGLVLLFGAVVIASPTIVAPTTRPVSPVGTLPWR